MPRLLSFAATVPQMRFGMKTVTRRKSTPLKPGDLFCAVSKSSRVTRLYEELGVFRVVSVKPGSLDHLTPEEVEREGFKGLTPDEFADLYRCAFGGDPVRIEFQPTKATAKAQRAQRIDAHLSRNRESRPVLVGQCPPRGKHRHADGWPTFFGGRSGKRLADVFGLGWRALVERFERRNLIGRYMGKDGRGDAFPSDLAVQGAAEMLGELEPNQEVICCGRAVWHAVLRAAGLEYHAGAEWGTRIHGPEPARRDTYTLIPHPSGLSRTWNDGKIDARVRRVCRAVARVAGLREHAPDCTPSAPQWSSRKHPFAYHLPDGSFYCPCCGYGWTF